MNERNLTGTLGIAAAAVWIFGCAWSLHTLRQLKGESERMHTRESALASMRNLATESAGYAAAREKVRADTGTLAPLAEVVSAKLPGVRTDDTRSRRESLGDGWSRHQQDLVFDDVPIAAVMALVDELESRRPPWRLAALEVRASAHTPGVGQVALTVEALQPER